MLHGVVPKIQGENLVAPLEPEIPQNRVRRGGGILNENNVLRIRVDEFGKFSCCPDNMRYEGVIEIARLLFLYRKLKVISLKVVRKRGGKKKIDFFFFLSDSNQQQSPL